MDGKLVEENEDHNDIIEDKENNKNGLNNSKFSKEDLKGFERWKTFRGKVTRHSNNGDDLDIPAVKKKLDSYRKEVCAFTKGESLNDIIDNFICHGFNNLQEIEAYRNKFDPGKIVARNPKPDSIIYQNSKVILDESFSKEINNYETPIEHSRLKIALYILVALVIPIGLAVAYGPELSNFFESNQSRKCVTAIHNNLHSVLADSFQTSHLRHVPPGNIEKLQHFLLDLSYDFHDKQNIDPVPRHAPSIRIQGDNPKLIDSFVLQMFEKIMGQQCFEQHVHQLDAEMNEDLLYEKLYTLIRSIKREDELNLGLIVVRNCHIPACGQRVKHFKDLLYDTPLPLPDNEYSAKGIGFVFLGGSMSNRECHEENSYYFDSKNGWTTSILSRIQYHIAICEN